LNKLQRFLQDVFRIDSSEQELSLEYITLLGDSYLAIAKLAIVCASSMAITESTIRRCKRKMYQWTTPHTPHPTPHTIKLNYIRIHITMKNIQLLGREGTCSEIIAIALKMSKYAQAYGDAGRSKERNPLYLTGTNWKSL
jgi:hypothetical protein